MIIKKYAMWLLFVSSAIIFTVGFRHYPPKGKQGDSFSTEKPQHRDLMSVVNTKGILMPQEIVRIGNIVNGIIRSVHFKENDLVKKGQLLVEVDDGREDADINANFANLDAAQAAFTYQTAFFKRQESLFARNQISLDLMQQAQRDYEDAYAKVEQAKALYEQAKLTFNNKQIPSTVSGMVIEIRATPGETISNDFGVTPVTIVCTIARDIELLKAYMVLDDAALEIVDANMSVHMTVDTYPRQKFTGTVSQVTGISHTLELADYPFLNLIPKIEKSIPHYAIAMIDNKDLSLRPGLTFGARIIVAEKENALSMPKKALTINKRALQELAEEEGYGYKPLDYKARHDLMLKDDAQTVWIYQNNAFIEKVVTVGISDADFTEITDGITDADEVVYEIAESKATPEKTEQPSPK